MNNAPAQCRICGALESEHASLNHEFSLDGQLRQKKPQSSEPPPIRIVRTADTELRALLIGKGLITADDLKLLPRREEPDAHENSSTAKSD